MDERSAANAWGERRIMARLHSGFAATEQLPDAAEMTFWGGVLDLGRRTSLSKLRAMDPLGSIDEPFWSSDGPQGVVR